jgi:hypothetical protein
MRQARPRSFSRQEIVSKHFQSTDSISVDNDIGPSEAVFQPESERGRDAEYQALTESTPWIPRLYSRSSHCSTTSTQHTSTVCAEICLLLHKCSRWTDLQRMFTTTISSTREWMTTTNSKTRQVHTEGYKRECLIAASETHWLG